MTAQSYTQRDVQNTGKKLGRMYAADGCVYVVILIRCIIQGKVLIKGGYGKGKQADGHKEGCQSAIPELGCEG